MAVGYQAVLWNRQKKIYDLVLLSLIGAYLISFVVFTSLFKPDVAPPTLIVRSTGSLAILMLHIILMIGPLCRIDNRFLPLLYNRRHLGVIMFFIALVHGGFSLLQFHYFGDINPILSVFVTNTHYDNLMRFPFQALGFVALIIFFLMAATSHDFWLHNLTPRIWKALHMMVYLAYVLVVMHVMLGVVQLESSSWLISLLGLGMLLIIALHLVSGFQWYRQKAIMNDLTERGFVKACMIEEIYENQAKMIMAEGQSIAIFKYDHKISAVNNICKHQNGPLSEGRIIDGCITCPWHGYQYLPESGSSPPPFEEKISTYEIRIQGKDIWVNPEPYAPGTTIKACQITS